MFFKIFINFKHTSSSRPAIRFSSDETVACRMATNEIQFFDAKDFSKGVIHRLRVPGVTAIELSRTPGTHIAAFVPESKVGLLDEVCSWRFINSTILVVCCFVFMQGVPASVQIFACGDSQTQPIARRSFFRCSTVQLNWNNGSTGLLIVVQADVDKTNQSYYGETKLNYLTTDGVHEGLVPLRKH